MRKLFFFTGLIAVAIQLQAQVKFKSLQFSPQFPQALQTVNFTFDASASTLAAEKEIDITVYLINAKNGVKAIEPVIQKEGNLYKGSFTTEATTNYMAFSIGANAQKESNAGNGYVVPVYDKNNQPVPGYYAGAAQLYMGMGEYLMGMDAGADKGFALLEEGKKTYPALTTDAEFLSGYLALLGAVKKKDAEPGILDALGAFGAGRKLTDTDYAFMADWYKKLKRTESADSVTALMKKEFPDGKWKKSENTMALLNEKNAATQEKMLEDFIAANQPLTDADKQTVQRVYARLANAYKVAGKMDELKKAAAQMRPAEKYALYNELAWGWAEENKNVELAEEWAAEASNWTKKEIENPTEKKSDMQTQKAWKSGRENTYAMYADTYAFILFNKGDYKKGLPYAKDAAELTSFGDGELNERYALLLEKAAPADEAKKVMEQMVSTGKTTAKIKDALKNVYTATGNDVAGFGNYIEGLEKAAKEKRRAEIAKSKISETAPAFSLKDFEGNEVSLKSLKGKVVVVDFWATWCGPCIASMPGMKMAEEKLKQRGDVVFLFIDTWENVTDKKQNAMNFMKKKKYDFHVLMDDDNKVVTDYGVKGIPAKFIIDKKGNISFKATGFNGSPDELVDELTTMVELSAM